MKILILGGKGLLGSDCKEVLGKDYEIVAPTRRELDIVSWDRVIEALQNVKPDIILNCAGFTDVDASETEYFKLRKTNVEGPRNLAQGSARFNCKVVHISSDYVFNGKKTVPQPYFEDDAVSPMSEYGKSKMEGEVGIRENAPSYIIIRTGWLYGINGNSFPKSIIRKSVGKKNKILKVVSDQYGSPTWTYRVALQIRELIGRDALGTYHATSEGYCSRFKFAKFVLDFLKLRTELVSCKMGDYGAAAERPANCILENRLLKKHGLNIMQDWKVDATTFLEQYGEEMINQAKAISS